MEQGRLFLAIVLSFLVFVAWEFLFVEKQDVQSPVPLEKVLESTIAEELKEDVIGAAEKLTEDSLERVATPGSFFTSLIINTPLYSATISEKGAAIVSFVLKDYRETIDDGAANKELISAGNKRGTALLGFTNKALPKMADAVFTTNFSGQTLEVRNNSKSISFFWQSVEGVLVEKRFSFDPETYKFLMDVILTNTSSRTFEENLTVSLVNSGPENTRQFSFEGPFAFVDNKLDEIKVNDLDEKNTISGNIGWAGLTEQYFMSTIIPEDPSASTIRLNHNIDDNLVEVKYIQEGKTLLPGAKQQFEYTIFMGPKQISVLKSIGSNLEKAINFGFFDVIAQPCLWLMNAIHDRLIPNYGIAIILLTILFKIIFWPLGTKSYKSMAEMKRLQPLMADIRLKHKDDKKKMNEEIMGLYKTYKVNPMSGCLPMVVQIPVFFAFYRMLYGSIELRHAPFLWWINDLSAPDRLFSFNFTIPMMTPPSGIPVLTIIMGATMFLQQKLSPPPGDPTQAKLMMMMPLIFTFIFINFPAGLVLYWLVNNVLSISQQYYITQKTV